MAPAAARTSQSPAASRARFFRALADPSRLVLLETLRRGERCVSELVEATGLAQSNVSGHLACLKECGLVESRQQWRHVYYRLAGAHVAHLLEEADLVLEQVAERIDACNRPEMGASA
jgi:DNA-binding transcriptional ArsR family regulator